MTYKKATQCYKVPKSTIRDRVRGKYKLNVADALRKVSPTLKCL